MGILVTFGQTKDTAGRQYYKSALRYPRPEPPQCLRPHLADSFNAPFPVAGKACYCLAVFYFCARFLWLQNTIVGTGVLDGPP